MFNYSNVKYSGILSVVDSDYIIARVSDTIDSAITTTIDSDYVNNRVSPSITIGVITDTVDSDYVQARQDFRYGSLTGRPQVIAVDDSTNDQIFYPYMVEDTTENAFLNPLISSEKLYFQPSTGQLTAVTYNSLSDVTYKQDITPIEDVFEILENINPVKFNWKETGKKSYGVIAQELEEIIPELVATNKGVKTVQYTPLIALLIEAIKELKKQIDNK